MTRVSVNLDRLDIDVQGLSPELVETAVSGLPSALERRLVGLQTAQFGDIHLSELALSVSTMRAPASAEALRSTIVEQLVEAIAGRQQGESD